MFFIRCLVLGIVVACASSVFAQSKAGEIININYKYRIAFTDLTEADVHPGDKVNVRMSDGSSLLLEVMESYPVMAKLSVPAGISDDSFAKVQVGAAVEPAGGSVAAAKTTPRADVRPVAREAAPAAPAAPTPGDDNIPSSVETFTPPANVAAPEAAVPEKKAVPAKRAEPKAAVIRSVMPLAEAPVPAPVIPQVQASPVIPATTDKVPADERLDKLMTNNINLSEQLTRLLADKERTDAVLKGKDESLKALQQGNEEISAAKKALEAQSASLQNEVDRLKARNADNEAEIKDLNQRLGELKKKLARMIDIVNKHMKSYE